MKDKEDLMEKLNETILLSKQREKLLEENLIKEKEELLLTVQRMKNERAAEKKLEGVLMRERAANQVQMTVKYSYITYCYTHPHTHTHTHTHTHIIRNLPTAQDIYYIFYFIFFLYFRRQMQPKF